MCRDFSCLRATNSWSPQFRRRGNLMLLERRATPRYAVDHAAPITVDSVVNGMIVNASESGLAIETRYKPVLNSVVRISTNLPGNDSPCETHAQVVWSSWSLGQMGLKILKPGSFRRHFETWCSFSNEANTAPVAAPPQADMEIDLIAETSSNDTAVEPSLDLEALKAAIREDARASRVPLLSWAPVIAGVMGCAVLGGAIWLWYSRSREVGTNLQASLIAGAATVNPSPQNLTQTTSQVASPPTAADTTTLPSTSTIAERDKSPKSAIIPQPPESRRASRAQIVVTLSRFTRLNPKLLHNPERIYFDLNSDTSPKLSKSSVNNATESRLVRRIRIGHTENGHTRLVVDLQRPCEYQTKLSASPPYKLIINIRAQKRKRT